MSHRFLRVVAFVVIVGSLCGVGAYVFQHRAPAPHTETEGAVAYAPDFTLPDETGALVQLSSVPGTVRVVNFWASWSPYSMSELPALVRLKETYGDKVTVLALNRDTDPREGRAFLERLRLRGALLFVYDHNDTYYKRVGGFNMPETLFVGEGERILAHVHGPMDETALRDTLSQLLAR